MNSDDLKANGLVIEDLEVVRLYPLILLVGSYDGNSSSEPDSRFFVPNANLIELAPFLFRILSPGLVTDV